MRPGFKIAITLLAVAGLLTQFTNCDVYSDSSVFDAASSYTCVNDTCVVSDADILEISAPPEMFVLSTVTSADMGGDCNEAGFPNSRVTWNLLQNGASIRNCTAVAACGQCLQGRYQITVSFPGVPVTGMQVEVEVKGVDANGVEHAGKPTIARRTVNVRVP